MPEQKIITPTDAKISFVQSAKPMLRTGQVIEDHPESGVVRTSCGYRDRNRVPEFAPSHR